MDNVAGKVVIHAPTGDATIKLALSRAAVAKVQVAGVDLVLVMADGTQHVFQGAALRALADPDFKLQFQDGAVEASTLITQAGPVNITDTLLRTIEKNTTADDTPMRTRKGQNGRTGEWESPLEERTLKESAAFNPPRSAAVNTPVSSNSRSVR